MELCLNYIPLLVQCADSAEHRFHNQVSQSGFTIRKHFNENHVCYEIFDDNGMPLAMEVQKVIC